MINAEVQLLDSAVLARIARILEIELTYLQNELNNVSTQAALIGSAAFFCLNMAEPYETHISLNDWIQTSLVLSTSGTVVASSLTLCSAMFLNLWGANDALRTKSIPGLIDAVSAIRQERMHTLQLFTITVLLFMFDGVLLTWCYWSPASAYCASTIFSIGIAAIGVMYRRTRKMFINTPPLFAGFFGSPEEAIRLRQEVNALYGGMQQESQHHVRFDTRPQGPSILSNMTSSDYPRASRDMGSFFSEPSSALYTEGLFVSGHINHRPSNLQERVHHNANPSLRQKVFGNIGGRRFFGGKKDVSNSTHAHGTSPAPNIVDAPESVANPTAPAVVSSEAWAEIGELRIVKRGWLTMKCGDGNGGFEWVPLYFGLTTLHLQYFTNAPPAHALSAALFDFHKVLGEARITFYGNQKQRHKISCERVDEDGEFGFVARIESGAVLKLRADSDSDRKEWIEAFESCSIQRSEKVVESL
jgi:hypothetical protein